MIHNFSKSANLGRDASALSNQEKADALRRFFENKWISSLKASKNEFTYTDMVDIAYAMRNDEDATSLYENGRIPPVIDKCLKRCIKIAKPPVIPIFGYLTKLICIAGLAVGTFIFGGGLITIFSPSRSDRISHWFSGGIPGGQDNFTMCIVGGAIILASFLLFTMKVSKSAKSTKCHQAILKAIDQWEAQLSR